MSEFGQNLKNMVIKSFETIGNTAGSIAATAKQKVETFNLSNQQKDLFTLVGEKVYGMFLKGIPLPEELTEDLEKISKIEDELKSRNEQKTEQSIKEEETSQQFVEKTDAVDFQETETVEYAAKDDNDIPVLQVEEDPEEDEPEREDCPLSSAINDLFEKMPPVDKMVDKVNNSLDELGDNLRKFTGEFDRQLNDFADQMMGKNDKEK